MRDDEQKLKATPQSGRKATAKDLEHDGQLKAASKRGHPDDAKNDPQDQRRVDDRKPPR